MEGLKVFWSFQRTRCASSSVCCCLSGPVTWHVACRSLSSFSVLGCPQLEPRPQIGFDLGKLVQSVPGRHHCTTYYFIDYGSQLRLGVRVAMWSRPVDLQAGG
jgi:hypothetical protein